MSNWTHGFPGCCESGKYWIFFSCFEVYALILAEESFWFCALYSYLSVHLSWETKLKLESDWSNWNEWKIFIGLKQLKLKIF